MIRSIEIQNFQSHARTRLDLDDFNIIVGLSGSGKTSVMRALMWLLYGDWDPEYPADKSKTTAVAIGLYDGTKILRSRHHDENRAAIILPGQAPKKFRNFGSIIPGIYDLINVRPIESNKKKIIINFALQDEPMFLLSSFYTKPDRAQWIGRLYGAHVVNMMIRILAKDKLSADADVRGLDNELHGLQDRVAAFSGLDARERALHESEAIFEALEGLHKARENLDDVRGKESVIDSGRRILDADLVAIRHDVEMLRKMIGLRDDYNDFAESARKVKESSYILKIDLDGIRESASLCESMQNIRDEYISALKDLEASQVSLEHINSDHSLESAEFKAKIFKGGSCPLCQSKSKKSKPEDIVRNFRALVGSSK